MIIYKIYNSIKELSSISIGYLLTALGGLLGVRILTAYLTPSQYGELSLGITMGGVIYSVFFGPLTNGITRFFPIAKEKKEISFYLFNVLNIIIKGSGFIGLISSSVIIILILSGNLEWIFIVLASISFGFIYSFNNVINGLQNASRKRIIVSINQGLMTFSRFFVAVIFINIFGSSSTIVIFGQLIGLFLTLIIQVYFLTPTLRGFVKSERYKISKIDWQLKISSFTRPLITIGLLNWLRIAVEKWGLLFFTNYDEAVGFYSIIYQFGYYPISLLINLLATYLRPIYFEKAGDTQKRLKLTYSLGVKIFIIAFLFFSLLILIVFTYREIIFQIILDEKYKSVSYLIGPMMMSALFNESTCFVSLLIQTKKETKPLLLPNSYIYLSGLILAILGAYFYGLYGVVFASLLNSSIKFILFSYLCIHHYKKIDYC